MHIDQYRVGLYEKALPRHYSWSHRLSTAYEAGYHFMEISIDESDARLARLVEPAAQRRTLVHDISHSPISIDTMCLSAHRRFPLGSADSDIRKRGEDIMRQAIALARDIGVRVIQLAGYDAYYEESTAETRARFLDSLAWAADLGARNCVTLAIENVDPPGFFSMEEIVPVITSINSPWLQIYGDFGNTYAAGVDYLSDIENAAPYIVALHVKDTRPGRFRDIPFQQGDIDFPAAFNVISKSGIQGPLVLEMWNEDNPDADVIVAEAREFIANEFEKGTAQ